MQPKGVTFESTPAYEGVEFLASRDDWFRPVNLELGPDGALYVVDMYRAVIEHPEWMPDELRHRPDLLDGNDRGRIYRIVPTDFKNLARPKLGSASNVVVLEQLAEPNAWSRDTAARLLLERQDKSIGPRLQDIAEKSDSPLVRIHALWLLSALNIVDSKMLYSILDDQNARVVEQAIRANELQIARSDIAKQILFDIASDSDDPRARFQALLNIPPFPPTPTHSADRWEVDATLIATGNLAACALGDWLQKPKEIRDNVGDQKAFAVALARIAAATKDRIQIQLAVDSLLNDMEFGRAGLTSLFVELAHLGHAFEDAAARLSMVSRHRLDLVLEDAQRDATDTRQPLSVRCDAVDLLSVTDGGPDLFVTLALEDPEQPVRLRSIAALARNSDTKRWQDIMASFANALPAVRSAILDGTLASPERTNVLFDEIAAGRIKPAQIDINHFNRLLQHRDKSIQSRAKELFAASIPQDRQKARG